MPMNVKRPCAARGCSELVDSGRCETHKRARWREYEAVRPPRDKSFYHSAGWLKVRAVVLAAEPLCRDCKAADRVVPATEVDHVLPISAGGEPLDFSNLAPLCLSCHSSKTMRENRAAGKL